MTEYDAVVYDLDGTLVRLPVDWGDVRERCAGVLRARDVDVSGADLWDMLELAEERGFYDRVHERIAEAEREAARRAERLPLADDLPHSGPVGVCSLNAVSACRIALELHGLDRHVDAVVGRDSLDARKPDPEPLLRVIEAIGASPGETLFVGDSDSDALAAERAGVDFEYVRNRTTELDDIQQS